MKIILLFLVVIFSSNAFSQEVTPPPPPTPMIGEEIVLFPDEDATFPGGNVAMMKFIRDSLEFPNDQEEFQGTVYIQFCVEKDGRLSELEILQGINTPYDIAAMDVIRKMPNWKPAVYKDKPVRSRVRLPIRILFH